MKLKISKLFHWLYATLMFLPILMFIPSCFYYGFNEHANANITQDTYLNFYQGVKNGKPTSTNEWFTYYTYEDTLNLSNGYINASSSTTRAQIDLGIYCELDYTAGDKLYFSFEYDPEMTTSVYVEGINNVITVFEEAPLDDPYLYYAILDTYNTYNTDIVDYILFVNYNSERTIFVKNVMIFNLTTIFGSGNEPDAYTFRKLIDSEYLNFGSNLKLVSKGHNITDSLNDSFNHLFDLPIFAWTKTTFVSNAFIYIGALFGISSINPIVYLFGYWLSLSICWLVFDLLIYVPNLVHRWLDRSAIE